MFIYLNYKKGAKKVRFIAVDIMLFTNNLLRRNKIKQRIHPTAEPIILLEGSCDSIFPFPISSWPLPFSLPLTLFGCVTFLWPTCTFMVKMM